ncbi:hypothetical protein JOE21_002068 [Desmospora profundinema]|uniref:Uncharacterized protein n=1 Tax=Desmospora profundinema TaxID=1571184 RepID=A0ABU1IMP9_9BACL|nr:hypothetical protein [Desmospora profundinema]
MGKIEKGIRKLPFFQFRNNVETKGIGPPLVGRCIRYPESFKKGCWVWKKRRTVRWMACLVIQFFPRKGRGGAAGGEPLHSQSTSFA